MKYIWKKCYKNCFEHPYRSNSTKIHLHAALLWLVWFSQNYTLEPIFDPFGSACNTIVDIDVTTKI